MFDDSEPQRVLRHCGSAQELFELKPLLFGWRLTMQG